VRPFLLLSSRADAVAADDEYVGFQKATGLDVGQLHRVRLEAAALPALDLDDYAGIFLGGGPFNSSDPPEAKTAVQHRVESDIRELLDDIVGRDFPFLGACYGVGTLGVHQGGIVDTTFAEPIGRVTVSVTEAGLTDPLLAGMPSRFDAFVGHKEACTVLPATAVLLAESPRCPVQMFRVKENVYATQFHPELDRAGIITRVRVYQHAGYFPPHEMDELIERLTEAVVTEPARVLANFVERYG
jgi:GMP synthase (glutamine-hydrolysing)